MSKILVTGATGQLGNEAVNLLLKKVDAANLAVLVRDPAKAADLAAQGVEIRQGDYDHYDTLVTAFQGIDKLYFVSSSDVAKRLAQHANVVKAAVAAKVGHIFYTSFQRKTEDETSPVAFIAASHLQTEQDILDSGLNYTLLKHALYSDVLPMFIGDQVLDTGAIFLPAGQGKAAYATRSDMAAAGAAALTTTGHENKVYDLSGKESVSFSDIAEMLSELSGKTITYVDPSPEAFTEELTKAGVPAEAIQGVVGFSVAIAQGEFDFPDTTLEKLIGRSPVSVKEYLKTAYGL